MTDVVPPNVMTVRRGFIGFPVAHLITPQLSERSRRGHRSAIGEVKGRGKVCKTVHHQHSGATDPPRLPGTIPTRGMRQGVDHGPTMLDAFNRMSLYAEFQRFLRVLEGIQRGHSIQLQRKPYIARGWSMR